MAFHIKKKERKEALWVGKQSVLTWNDHGVALLHLKETEQAGEEKQSRGLQNHRVTLWPYQTWKQ